jgi:integrase
LISEGCHLGYFRGQRAGKWVARYRRPGEAKGYIKERIGEADDVRDADGIEVLTFAQAQDKARGWFSRQASGGAEVRDLTIADAVTQYIKMRNARAKTHGGPRHSSAHYTLGRHVLADAKLSRILLSDISQADLRSWQRRLKGIGAATRERIATDFKAALNTAFEEHRRSLPSDLPVTIKFGLKPLPLDSDADASPARENQVLGDDEVRRLLETARELDKGGDHYRLALLLAATGARFSQVMRMIVGDVQPEHRRVRVPASRKGKGKAAKYVGVPVGADVLDACAAITKGRSQSDALLERWRYRQVSPTEWVRVDRRAWTSASEMTRWWNQVAAAAKLPGVIPYALRHSSIVRGIGSGLPIRLVAAMHDTSVAMIEKHYSRWISESLDELAARAVVPLVEKPQLAKPAARRKGQALRSKRSVNADAAALQNKLFVTT